MSTVVGSCLSYVPSYVQVKESVLYTVTKHLPFRNRKVGLRLNDPKTGQIPSRLTQIKFGFFQGDKVRQRDWSLLKTIRKIELRAAKELYELYTSKAAEKGLNAGYLYLHDFVDAEGRLLDSWLSLIQPKISPEAMSYLLAENPNKFAPVNGVYPEVTFCFTDMEKLLRAKLLTFEEVNTEFGNAVDMTLELQRNSELVLEEFFKDREYNLHKVPLLRPKMDAVLKVLDQVCRSNRGTQEGISSLIANGKTKDSTLDTWFIKAAAEKLKSVTQPVQKLTLTPNGAMVTY